MATNYAGQCGIKKVTLTNYLRVDLDITDLVVEINVFEDMFSNVLTGNLLILDAVSLAENLPIIGQEKINIQLESVIWGTFKLEFLSFSITNRHVENHTTISYMLNFTSKEIMDDRLTKISKPYKGTTAQIAQTIFKENIVSTKSLSVDASKHNTKFIVPYWSPFEAINYMATRSVPNSGANASFFFFENLEGFQFRSVETLFGQPELAEFKYRDSNIAGSLVVDQIQFQGLTIENYEVLENSDILKGMNNGLLGTTVYSKDVTKNQWNKKDWNYLVEFPKGKHLNDTPILPETNSYNFNLTKRANETRLAYTHNKITEGIEDQFFPNQWIGSRLSMIQQLTSTRLSISIPGHILINVGKTVRLTFPSNQERGPQGRGNDKESYLSGKYLITAVRHVFKLKEHRISFEASKESYLGPGK